MQFWSVNFNSNEIESYFASGVDVHSILNLSSRVGFVTTQCIKRSSVISWQPDKCTKIHEWWRITFPSTWRKQRMWLSFIIIWKVRICIFHEYVCILFYFCKSSAFILGITGRRNPTRLNSTFYIVIHLWQMKGRAWEQHIGEDSFVPHLKFINCNRSPELTYQLRRSRFC